MSTLSRGSSAPGANGAKRAAGGSSTRRGSRGFNPLAKSDNAAKTSRGGSPGSRGGRGKGGSAPLPAARGSLGTTRGGKGNAAGNNEARDNRPPSAVGSHRQNTAKPVQADRKSKPASPFAAIQSTIDHSRDPRRQNRDAKARINGSQDYNSRYEQLKQNRAKERTRAIQTGQMADPNQPISLSRAITPTGTCTEMCPEFERVERMVQKMVDKSEKLYDPETGTYQNVEAKMIKRFRRSAAGYDEQLPSDIRTPKTLLQTMNYMLRHVISEDDSLGTIHKFVWDRTRSIRNDLSIQQLTQAPDVEVAVKCLERIARFHIASLHLLSSPDNTEQFDQHQEREQLNNTLLSLLYYYDDNRDRIKFLNEDEFRAYYIVFSIHDQRPDLEARVQKWPRELRQSPRIQVALELFAAAGNIWEYQAALDAKRPSAVAQGFYSRFFNIVRSERVSYLMGCIAEIYFNQVRQTAIRSIWKAYCRQPLSQQHKNHEWTISELTKTLSFDDRDQAIAFCEEQGLQLSANQEGCIYLNWADRSFDSVDFQPSSQQSFSERLVEAKRRGRTLVALILGMNVAQAINHGMIDESLFVPESASAKSDHDEALFVSDDEAQDNVPVQAEAATSGSFPALGANTSGQFQQGTNQQAMNVFTSGSQGNTQLSANAPPFAPKSSLGSTVGQIQNPIFSGPPPQNPPSITFGASSNRSGTSQTNGQHYPSSAPSTSSTTPNAKPTFSSTFPSFGTSNAFQDSTASSKTQSAPNPFASANTPFSKPDSTTLPDQKQGTNSFGTFTSASSSTATKGTESHNQPVTTSTDNGTGIEAPNPPNRLFQQFPPSGFGQDSSNNGGIFSRTPFADTGAKTPSTSPPTSSIFFPASQASQQQGFQASQPSGSTLSAFDWSGTAPNKSQSGPELPESQPTEDQTATEQKRAEQEAKEQAQREFEKRQAEKRKAERIEAERQEAERKEAERQEAERKAAEKREAERKEAERLEAERKEAERKATAKRERERREHELAKRAAQEVKAAQSDIERFRASERKVQDRDASVRKTIEQEITKRKASHEEEDHTSSRGKSKAPRLPEESPLTVEELLGDFDEPRPKSSPPKTAMAKKPLIDEDELLLSSARLAAHTLSKGRLFEHEPAPDFRASVSSAASSPNVTASRARSLSSVIDSSDRAMVNGHEVALAPSTPLGLGRSLSRTEQRIRSTGASGLAFKPIMPLPRSTSTKEKSKSKSKRRRMDSSSSAFP